MAAVNASDIPEEQRFMSDFWAIRKKYYNAKSNEEWEGLINEFAALSEKYNRNPYFDELLIVCADDIDRRFRQQTGSRFVDGDPVKTVYERMRKKG